MSDAITNRRDFLQKSSIVGVVALTPSIILAHPKTDTDRAEGEEPGKVSPAEYLMREHSVLNRVLLIYDHHLQLLAAKKPFDGSVLANAADIVLHFVEEYHEKLEEDYLFPRFRKVKKLLNLVDTLQAQHKAGRELTAHIRELSGLASFKYVSSDSEKLEDVLTSFLRMYRPHESREDTVLFPAFRSIISPREYAALGDEFEKRETRLLGSDGFFHVVDRVTTLEKRLGIYELAQFTPK